MGHPFLLTFEFECHLLQKTEKEIIAGWEIEFENMHLFENKVF